MLAIDSFRLANSSGRPSLTKFSNHLLMLFMGFTFMSFSTGIWHFYHQRVGKDDRYRVTTPGLSENQYTKTRNLLFHINQANQYRFFSEPISVRVTHFGKSYEIELTGVEQVLKQAVDLRVLRDYPSLLENREASAVVYLNQNLKEKFGDKIREGDFLGLKGILENPINVKVRSIRPDYTTTKPKAYVPLSFLRSLFPKRYLQSRLELVSRDQSQAIALNSYLSKKMGLKSQLLVPQGAQLASKLKTLLIVSFSIGLLLVSFALFILVRGHQNEIAKRKEFYQLLIDQGKSKGLFVLSYLWELFLIITPFFASAIICGTLASIFIFQELFPSIQSHFPTVLIFQLFLGAYFLPLLPFIMKKYLNKLNQSLFSPSKVGI